MTYQSKGNPSIPATLTIEGQARTQKLPLVYRHRTQAQWTGLLEKMSSGEITQVDLILDIVESWDVDVPLDAAGIEIVRQNQPGVDFAIINGFSRALAVELQKN